MTIYEPLKRILSLIIVACFFLPLSQCSHPDKQSVDNNVQQVTKNRSTLFIPATDLSYKDPDGIPMVFAFFWPLGAMLLRRRCQSKKSAVIANVFEIFLTLASMAYIEFIIQLWGTIKFGGVICLSAYAAYLLTCGGYLVSSYRKPN